MQRHLFTISVFFMLASFPVLANGLDLLKDFQGISYDEHGRPVGMPMGGVGAGTIELTSAGTLAEFRNINNWAVHLPSIPASGLCVTVRQDGQTKVYPLSAGRVQFEGNFPFARLRFPDLPVQVTLWGWSPFILHDLRRSAYPAAIFDAQITNPTDKQVQVGLVLSYGTDYADWLQKIALPNSEQAAIRIESIRGEFRGAGASGITFRTRAALDLASVEARAAQVRKDLEAAYMQAYDLTPLDISAACNRSYVHHPFADNKEHAKLDFADLKAGKQLVYGIPFVIADDETNHHKSVVIAGSPSGQSSVRIPVQRKADCVFILGNCAGWANAMNSSVEYVLNYSGGGEKHVPLRNGYELTDWMGGAAVYCPATVHGKSSGGSDYIINMFAIPTDGGKEVESLELRSTGAIAPMVFAVTTGTRAKLPLAEGIVAMRRADVDRMVGSAASLKLTGNTDAEYALAARAIDGGETVAYSVATPADLMKALEDGRARAEPKAGIYAIEQRLTLAPKQSGVAGLICSWYAPNHIATDGHRFGHKYEEWFKNAEGVAQEIARDHDALLADTKRHYDLIATCSFPKWFRELIQSNFYTLPACTWLTKDDVTFMYESPDGCALFGTMDVRYYGSFPMLAAFPELDARVLKHFAAVQNPDGFIIHDLGGSSGIADTVKVAPDPPPRPVEPKKNRHDYDGYWVNLPIKFCLEVARHYQWTGDRDFLEQIWPNVKRAITWVRAQDEDDDGLPETYYGYDGWKMYDKSNYDANQWVAMLPAVARLASDLGEAEFAADLMKTHVKAVAAIEKHLWTGRYFRQAMQNDGRNDMVSIIQTAGNWYADILGYDDGVPREQVRSALTAIDEINGKDAVLGVTDCVFPDGSHNDSWISIGVGIGWNYYYATACMYEGLDAIALRICDEIWRQYTVEMCRLPWCQEEFFHDARKPTCPYWLLRDMRMGVALLMAHAAAGLHVDMVKGEARIRPTDWVWNDGKFTLPIILPKWLGQAKYHHEGETEVYEITSIAEPIELQRLMLRTRHTSPLTITIGDAARSGNVSPDNTVDVGGIRISAEPVIIRIAKGR